MNSHRRSDSSLRHRQPAVLVALLPTLNPNVPRTISGQLPRVLLAADRGICLPFPAPVIPGLVASTRRHPLPHRINTHAWRGGSVQLGSIRNPDLAPIAVIIYATI